MVALTWAQVPGAQEYEIYRRVAGTEEWTTVGRETLTTTEDDPGVDGVWEYTVSSVRMHQGQESISEPAPEVLVHSDRVAPGPPENLDIELVGNGIKLEWQPSLSTTESITYQIYRSADENISTIEGMDPLVTGITQLLVVDPTPSESEHAYTVAAVDAAGNVSPPAPSVYLNPGLLPVSSLAVELTEGSIPVVTWSHPTAAPLPVHPAMNP